MFEHFGIMDVFAEAKKYKITLLSIISMFSIVFFSHFLFEILKPCDNYSGPIYISSGTYYVEPNEPISGLSDFSIYKSLPDDYLAMLDSDVCRKYILDQLTMKYTQESIHEKSGLNDKTKIDENAVKELCYASRILDSMVIEISCATYDKELSESIRNIYHKFLSDIATKYMTNSSLKLTGKIDRTLKQENIKYENINKDDSRSILKPKSGTKTSPISLFLKKVLMPIILIVILCITAIIIMGVLNPRMNRMSDFAEYDIPIIGEIKNFTKKRKVKKSND